MQGARPDSWSHCGCSSEALRAILGMGCGEGQLSAVPQARHLGFRVPGGGFGVAPNLLPSSHLAKARWFWHQGRSRGVWDQPWLCCGCCQLSHLHAGQGQVLGARSGSHCCQQDQGCSHWSRGANPNPPPPPALQHRQGLEARAACACSICWEPGKGWPCQMCEHSWGEAMPTSLSSYFNPKVGLSVPPEPLLHLPGVGVAAQHSGTFLAGFGSFL